VVLLILESTDLVFAVDSVPAMRFITHDPFIVYTSTVFAILGLRSMFFTLEGIMHRFHHLHYGLSAVLVFVGAKMLLAGFYKIPTWIFLLFIVSILTISMGLIYLTLNRSNRMLPIISSFEIFMRPYDAFVCVASFAPAGTPPRVDQSQLSERRRPSW
jgi:predicted tellurium resistance membrane protein TerC